MADIPCPHCGEVLKVNPDALGSQLVCPKCHVILRLAKDDEKTSLLAKVRRLLPRKVAAGLVCLLVLASFVAGYGVGSASARRGNNRGTIMNAFGVFSAHNEMHVHDGAAPKSDKKSE
jgi:hypothetical protein